MKDHYKPLAKHYDLLSKWYSLGRIDKCRNAYLGEISEAVRENPNLRICYVGAGHGKEAIHAAEVGAMVTVVDTSESMLEIFQSHLRTSLEDVRVRVKVEHQDVREFAKNLVREKKEKYDWVIANFFLNVFTENELQYMLEDFLGCCSEVGYLVISDFHLDSSDDGNVLTRLLQRINWYSALLIFRFWVKNAFHSVYDYSAILEGSKWEVSQTKKFRYLGVNFYEALLCQKIGVII